MARFPTRETILFGAIAALAAVSLWSPTNRASAGASPATPAAVQPDDAPAAPATAAPGPPVPAAAATPADRSRQLELPDGTFVPSLNGAVGAAPLAQHWGSQIPWSPIVGIENNDQGVDWYRHANGSYSTTQMVWRSDLKRHEAMTRVGHRGPDAPPVAK